GKENGLKILQSIDQGPFELGTTRDALGTTPEGDVRATNIVLQGLPKDIYKLINHNIKAKVIWDNVKMLLAGSELIKEDRESQLYDEFKRFKMLPGENINEYYVRFHKLVNDMRNIKMTMPNIQLNSKFVNNMSPEWDSPITLISFIINKTSITTISTFPESNNKRFRLPPKLMKYLQPTNQNGNYLAQVIPEATHVSDEQINFKPSSNTRNQATIQDGRVVVQNVQGRQNQNQRYLTQGNGAAGNRGAQNRAGNANAGQGKPVKCYNCNGIGHIAWNCTQPVRPTRILNNSRQEMYVQAQEKGMFGIRELLFLVGEQGNTFDADVDNQPVQDLALNEDNIF
ncbi:retrovirus-related pol polyprotein from transposon TNT 1-94, partial [Tanacetum coccineum]